MNIGDASLGSGLPRRTIRYYESIGLVVPIRGENGYRDYSATDVACLRVLQGSRGLGFSIEESRLLLSLYQDQNRSSADVRALATDKIAEIEKKIEELQRLRQSLETLVTSCNGDERPECPIIDCLAGEEGSSERL